MNLPPLNGPEVAALILPLSVILALALKWAIDRLEPWQ